MVSAKAASLAVSSDRMLSISHGTSAGSAADAAARRATRGERPTPARDAPSPRQFADPGGAWRWLPLALQRGCHSPRTPGALGPPRPPQRALPTRLPRTGTVDPWRRGPRESLAADRGARSSLLRATHAPDPRVASEHRIAKRGAGVASVHSTGRDAKPRERRRNLEGQKAGKESLYSVVADIAKSGRQAPRQVGRFSSHVEHARQTREVPAQSRLRQPQRPPRPQGWTGALDMPRSPSPQQGVGRQCLLETIVELPYCLQVVRHVAHGMSRRSHRNVACRACSSGT